MKTQVKKELLTLCGLGTIALLLSRQKRLATFSSFASAYLLAKLYIESTLPNTFRGQSAIITGGSRGLGLAIAARLVQENCNVTLIARDENELKRAKNQLEVLNRGEVHTITCDVTNPAQLSLAIHNAAEHFDGIDLLINNAGTMIVGPWESMTKQDFESQLNIHLYAVMNAIQISLPYLREKNSGRRIVNICSMNGRVAIPHSMAHNTSKFALAGYSQGLATELYDEGISVTTVYPLLVRTGSAIQAVFKGDHEKEFAWFQSADVMPVASTAVQDVAARIVEAARERRFELVPFLPAKFRFIVKSLFPELVAYSLVLINRLLPKGQSGVYKTGAQSREIFDNSIITRPFRSAATKAEEESNQTAKLNAKEVLGLMH